MNDPTFETQQFLEAGPARREAEYKLQSGQLYAQGLPGIVHGYQQAQQMQQQVALAQSHLANDEVERQGAYENLRYAQALHSTDMIAAQKDAVVSKSRLEQAQADKLRRDIESPPLDFDALMHEDVLPTMIEYLHQKPELVNGRWKLTTATAEDLANSRKDREARRQRLLGSHSPELDAARTNAANAQAELARARATHPGGAGESSSFSAMTRLLDMRGKQLDRAYKTLENQHIQNTISDKDYAAKKRDLDTQRADLDEHINAVTGQLGGRLGMTNGAEPSAPKTKQQALDDLMQIIIKAIDQRDRGQ